MKGILLAGAAAIAVLGLWACDGDDGGGTETTSSSGSTSSGSSADLVERWCEGEIARDELCGNTPTELAECLAWGPCLIDFVRPEILEALVTCLIERDCHEDGESCYYQVGTASPTTGQEDFHTACLVKRESCTNFSDDWCFLVVGPPERYEAMSACLDLPCEQIFQCFEATDPESCQH